MAYDNHKKHSLDQKKSSETNKDLEKNNKQIPDKKADFDNKGRPNNPL